MVTLTNTIINPGTMMIHFSDTTLTYRTVMSSFRFDRTTFGTLKYHLTFFETHLLNVFFGSISSRHLHKNQFNSNPCTFFLIFGFTYSTRISKHCSDVRRKGKNTNSLKEYCVYYRVNCSKIWQEDDFEHNKFCINY